MVTSLSHLEQESIEYFVSFAQILGLPKSIGQIYGLMFVTSEPLTLDEIRSRLCLSKGSVSQGLGTLRELGAIIPVEIKDDRREHFVADLQVSRIVNHFLAERLEPRLKHGESRLESMIHLAQNLPPEEVTAVGKNENEQLSRLLALQKWQQRGKKALPFIRKLMKV